MSTPPDARPTRASRRSPIDALLTLGRPVLLISFALYRREVKRSLYPRDVPVTTVEGIDPVRLLFVGDVAAAGHGVLSHGLTVATQTAERIAAETHRGAEWSVIADPELTSRALARRRGFGAEGVEVAFLLLGIPDVLLLTSPESWGARLEAVVGRIQSESGLRAPRVVISGIEPMADFRPIHPTARRIIQRQIARLDHASADLAARLPGVDFVPFPSWRVGDMFIKEMFSWKTMHESWADTLAAALRPGA